VNAGLRVLLDYFDPPPPAPRERPGDEVRLTGFGKFVTEQ
jgi:hypothetical protein